MKILPTRKKRLNHSTLFSGKINNNSNKNKKLISPGSDLTTAFSCSSILNGFATITLQDCNDHITAKNMRHIIQTGHIFNLEKCASTKTRNHARYKNLFIQKSHFSKTFLNHKNISQSP